MRKFAEKLDARYEPRRQRLYAVVTSAPMLKGRSTGQVTATVGGVAGVRVEVPTDLRTPISTNDGIWVEGVGTPAAMTYRFTDRVSGSRADSDVYIFPAPSEIDGTPYGAGDIVLGSTLADMSNWWYQFFEGRWVIRQGTAVQGALGNLKGIYGYVGDTYGSVWGQYAPGQIWTATDADNGFRIMNFDARTFVIDPEGYASFGRDGAAEITINPGTNEIRFITNGVTQMTIDADGRTIHGLERLGRELGPAIEFGPIADPSGDENLERYGFWVRDATDRFFGVWSGNTVDPSDAGLRIGAQGAAKYLDFSDGDLDIAAQMQILGDSEVVGDLAVTDGTLTWANGKGILSSTGLSHIESGSSYFAVNAASANMIAAQSNLAVAGTPVMRVTTTAEGSYGISGQSLNVTSGIGIYGYAVAGTGVWGRATINGPGVLAEVLGGANPIALQIAGGIVDGGSQRYTAMGTASAGTDGLNRDTADGRYLLQSAAGMSHWTRTLIVDAGGDGDYTTIKAACDYVATQSPGADAKWTIQVMAGNYVEAPFTIPTYTALVGMSKAPTLSYAEGVYIAANAELTTGAFITAGISSALYNVSVYAICAAAASAECQVASAYYSAFSNVYITGNNKSATQTLNIIKGTLFIDSSTVQTSSTGGGPCVALNVSYSQIRFCYIPSNAATGSRAVLNTAGNSTLFHTRIGITAGTNFPVDLEVTGGTLYINNTPYKTGSGAIVHVDRFYPSLSAVREAPAATDTPLIVKGAAAQTADLVQIQSSAATLIVVDDAGNVGIGTTVPSSMLHVKTGTDQNFKVGTLGGAELYIATANDANTGFVPLRFYASEYNFSNGNVGIGTTTPGYKLEVVGGVTKLAGLLSPYTRTLVVDAGGKGDYTTIKAACDYVATQSPGSAAKWTIQVMPGDYVEAPFTLPTYTTLVGMSKAPTLSYSENVYISANVELTTGAFLTAGISSALYNVSVYAVCAAGANAECQVVSTYYSSFSNVYILGNNKSATQTLNIIKGVLFIDNSTIQTSSTGGGPCVALNVSYSQIRFCYIPSNAAPGSSAVTNTAGNSSLFYTRIGATTGTTFPVDLNITGGSLYVNNTPYKVGTGSIVHNDRFFPTSAGVREAPSATDTPLIVKGAAAQTADLVQIQSSAATLVIVDDAGNVGIGTASPDRLLHVESADAVTDAVTYAGRLSHITSGTAAAGFGTGLEAELEDDGGTNRVASYIETLWNSAAAASYKADLVLKAVDSAGTREGLRIRGSGSAATIGFLGATPVARAAHIADASGGATVDTEARAAINALLAVIENLGFTATS